ncbi:MULTISPECIES: sugar transferase [unclassified Microbacterium]|uniref:sugar transferase n=1 Tax=unclassified Microbacterium TaxID=2609290 RepID=UPI001E522888|nr:sugar transferase [Microbacterium sp. Au-Mic1]MCE4027316.1 sugar transferase [Microbacterium sp. Au-Mic1]
MFEKVDLVATSHTVAQWRHAYATRLAITDTVVVFASVMIAQVVRFGFGDSHVVGLNLLDTELGYSMFSIGLALAWLLSLRLTGSRNPKLVGGGTLEYKRVMDASVRLFGVLAILAFGFQLQIARGYVLVAFPIGLGLLFLGRWQWRRWLLRQRTAGRYAHHAVLLGEREKSRHVGASILREPGLGVRLLGAVTENGSDQDLLPDVPVIGGFDRAIEAIRASGADTVVYSGSDRISPEALQELGWELEEAKIELLVAPALTGVAGPRLHSNPTPGLPLIQVDYPTFEGMKYVAKRTLDIAASIVALIVLSPLFAIIALLVRQDGGSALFRQQRIGVDGRRFEMLKFRTMVVDAEDRLPTLLDHTDGNGVLFKMRHDPRVTPVGRLLRRHSLDELPQLVNVLRGNMSLVGPRPPLASEVEHYDYRMQRRFLVRPGLTGLWQVNGRSDLSWDDSVRLDLFYVENWSLTGDLIILWRTLRVVSTGVGAY